MMVSTFAPGSCEIGPLMDGNRYAKPLRWAVLGIAAVALPGGAAYLLAAESKPASHVPFSNEGTGLGASNVQSAIAELAAKVKTMEESQTTAQNTVTVQEKAITSQRNDLSALQTATQDQSIRMAGQEARLAILESKAAENLTVRRRIDYAEEAGTDSVTANYEPLRTLGTFSKQHASTSVFLAWTTHVEVQGESGTFCDFQLRIDGKPDTEWEGGGGRAVVYVPESGSTTSPVSVYALFGKKATGSHSVGVWVRGSARACRENPGNFPRSVLIEEGARG